VASIKNSVAVDGMHREAAHARMRVLVKRLLRKCGYPPDFRTRRQGRKQLVQVVNALLDHLVGAGKYRGRHGEAERLGGSRI
jgi:hypothetical protein